MKLDVQKMIDDLALNGGGTLVLPTGPIEAISPWEIPNRVIVRGAGPRFRRR